MHKKSGNSFLFNNVTESATKSTENLCRKKYSKWMLMALNSILAKLEIRICFKNTIAMQSLSESAEYQEHCVKFFTLRLQRSSQQISSIHKHFADKSWKENDAFSAKPLIYEYFTKEKWSSIFPGYNEIQRNLQR